MTTVITPKWLYIDGRGHAHINGKKEFSFDLPQTPRGWNFGDLEYAFREACLKYDLPIPEDDREVHRIIHTALKSFGKKVIESNDASQKKGDIEQNNDVDDQEKRPDVILYTIATEEIVEMFRDQELKTPYAIIDIEGKRYVLNMESEEFRLKLSVLYERHIKSQPDSKISHLISENDLNKVIRLLLGHNEQFKKLYQRCYFDGATIYFDFENKDYQYARITHEGYSIEKDSYHIFKRSDEQHEQALPDRESNNGGELLDSVNRSFNIIDYDGHGDRQLLFKVSIVTLLFGKDAMMSNPIWTVNGPPGAAKTTLLLWPKYLIDPERRYKPKSMSKSWGKEEQSRDRGLTVAKNYFVVFDNISRITDQESDELCRYSTGGSVMERKLHTNTETVNYDIQGHVGYTSINDVARQADLISRQLKFELDLRLDIESERKFWGARAKEVPAILHYLFTVAGRAIPIYNRMADDPDYKTTHRLADFIQLGEAISQAMGEKPKRFMSIFNRIEQEQAERSIDNSSFATLFADYVLNELSREGQQITKYAKDLYTGVNTFAELKHHNTYQDPEFPKNVNAFGKRIEKIKGALLKLGIKMVKDQRTSEGIPYRIDIIALRVLDDYKSAPNNAGNEIQMLSCKICSKFESIHEDSIEHHIIYTHGKKDLEMLRHMAENDGNDMSDSYMADQLLTAYSGRYSKELAEKIVKAYPHSKDN